MCVPTIHNMQHKLFVRTTLKEFFVGFLYLFDRPNHTPNLMVWNSKTYPKFGVWNPKKYTKFGVWNGSGKIGVWNTRVLVGRKKNFPVLKPPTSHPNLFLILYMYICVCVCIFNSHITLNSSAYLYILVFHNL